MDSPELVRWRLRGFRRDAVDTAAFGANIVGQVHITKR
jgi:hypothetical protein